MGPNKETWSSPNDDWPSLDDPLLETSHTRPTPKGYKSPRQSGRSLWPFALHIIFLAAYTAIFLVVVVGSDNTRDLAYTPVGRHLPVHTSTYDDEAPNDFRGKPRPALDRAWHNLLQHGNIHLSEDELRQLNRSAIPLHDGSGYYGAVNVYHHLHCLKTIRQVIHEDYYHTGISADDHHLDHCIDAIRLALMCNPDIGMTTYDWMPGRRKPKPNPEIHRTCIDWNALDEWSAERSFDTYDQRSLVHPQFGIIYPLVDGDYELITAGPKMHIVWPSV